MSRLLHSPSEVCAILINRDFSSTTWVIELEESLETNNKTNEIVKITVIEFISSNLISLILLSVFFPKEIKNERNLMDFIIYNQG